MTKKHVSRRIAECPTDYIYGNAFQHCNSEQTAHMSILAICACILLGLWAVETVAFFVSYWQSAKGSATDTIETHL